MDNRELKKLKSSQYRIWALENRIETLRAQMENIVRILDNTPVQSTRREILSEQIARLDEWERELEAERLDLIDLKRMAYDAFKVLPDSRRAVMEARYLDGLSWAKVAEKTHYSVSACKKIDRRFREG